MVTRSPRTSAAVLTAAGLASAVLCIAEPGGSQLVQGATFGIAIVASFALFEGYRAPYRFLALVCACSAAYPLSILGGLGVRALFQWLVDPSAQSDSIPLFYLFAGGSIGACIVLFSAIILFGPMRMSPAAVGATVAAVFLSGFLALTAGAVGRRLGRSTNFSQATVFVFWQTGVAAVFLSGFLALTAGAVGRRLGRSTNFSQATVFVFWQTGVAALLGFLLQWMRRETTGPSDRLQANSDGRVGRRSGIPAGLFLVAVLGGFLFFLGSAIYRHLTD
jgi:hypothetical protein